MADSIESMIGVALSVTVVVVSVGVAWGKLAKGQADLKAKLIDVQHRVEGRLADIVLEMKNFPTIYVRTDVDNERNKLMDERDTSIRIILNDIRDELKHLRRGP